MTCSAVGQAPADVDLVGGDELGTLSALIARRLPGHVEDLVARPNEFVRVAMTIETPFHVKSGRAPGDRHLIDAPVARRATDSFRDVNAVIEPDVIGQVIDTVPLQGSVRGET